MHALQSWSNESSVAPVLVGNCAYAITADRVQISLDQILNPRDVNDISGTLAIELWALPQAYQGDEFTGVALASTEIGSIFGQHSLNQCEYDLVFTAPPQGSWNVTLMLREWTGVGYITRDFMNFPVPYEVASVEEVAPEVVATIEAIAPEVATPEVVETTEAVASDVVVAAAPVKKAAAPKKAKSKKAAATPASKLDWNTASEAEIAALKGVSSKLAAAIVAARPFTGLDQVLAVKGMGKKLLDKLCDDVTLA
jgi:DNA uptake protein ComE-like DNA-binding protein